MSESLLAGRDWNIHHGDCIPHMHELPRHCMDFSVFSPPFPSLYAYTSHDEDIGNSEDFKGDAKLHLSFFFKALVRVMKPGRVVVVHVAQIPRMKRVGGRGLLDFRGLVIRLAERAGFTFEYDWSVGKNPQAQAIRTHSHELQFAGLERDRAKTRGCLPDYLIKLLAPGDNAWPITGDDGVSRNEWIDWAESHWPWTDIKETDTLNTACAKGENDTRHICPLQLPVIRRLVRLYSLPKEVVFSPFTGIGSEGFEAIKCGRLFYGCELKNEYHREACRNLERAVKLRDESQIPLFAS